MTISTKTKTKSPTTTLAISGLGARQEDIDKAVASGMFTGVNMKKRLNLLLYGPFGTSKTVTAHGLPNTRTLDFDDGMQSVEWAIRMGLLKKAPNEIAYKTILPDPNDPRSTRVIDEAAETVDQWIEEEDIPPEEWDRPYPQFWDTLIIDSGSFLKDSAMVKALKENARLGISKSLDKFTGRLSVTPMMIQDWGSAGSLFQKFITNCRSIGKNVVLICHEYTETDDSGMTIAVEPLLIGQLRKTLPAGFDEVWYMKTKGSKKDPQYLIQTAPDTLHRLRSRTGCLEYEEPADFLALRKKIARFYDVPEDSLWTAYHGEKGVEQATAEVLKEGNNLI